MNAWPPSGSATSASQEGARQPAHANEIALHALFDGGVPHDTAAPLMGLSPPSNAPKDATPALLTSPWNTGLQGMSSSNTTTYGSRQSPELNAFYGQMMGSESSQDQGSRSIGGVVGLGGGGANPSPRLYASSSLSRSQRHPAPPAALDGDEKLLPQRDEMLLPRRNHTIASGSVDYRRRLERHFQQQASQQPPSQQHNQHSTPLTSPTKNSLSAITGGEEEADNDWEAMIRRKESLIPTSGYEDDAREELNTAPWRPVPAVDNAGHRRYPSQPNTTFGTSPVDSTSSSLSGKGSLHQRSESAHANRGLNEGPFASSPIIPGTAFGSNAGLIRRHQSLNYHAGRQVGNQLGKQGRQEEQQQQQRRSGIVSPALSMTQSNDVVAGAIRPTVHQAQSSSPAQSPIGTGSFPFSDRAPAFSGAQHQHRASAEDNGAVEYGPSSSTTQLSTSLMDTHAQLMRMSLNPASDAQSGNSANKSLSPLPSESRLRKLPSLITNRDELARGAASGAHQHGLQGVREGPVSAAAYVPPIGHGHHRNAMSGSGAASIAQTGDAGDHRPYEHHMTNASFLRGPLSAFSTPFGGRRGNVEGGGLRDSDQAHAIADRRRMEENGCAWHADNSGGVHRLPAVMNANRHYQPDIMRFGNPITMTGDGGGNQEAAMAALHQQSAYWLPSGGVGVGMPFTHAGADAVNAAALTSTIGFQPMTGDASAAMPTSIAMPAHLGGGEVPFDPAVNALIQSKGYNPPWTHFNVNPPKARYFVIKSFTEDDVQRSLKHEIWASTEKGNQRLDRAFKESSGDGPLYLLFSVNASGHFCGIAEMLTPLDYSSDSNVWAQEGKWKGSFKVRWIYVKDVPNNRLRHIRLTNTPECKPITQSRDTQELPVKGGQQALKIIAEFPSRTTLLQDWLFYEQQQPLGQEHRPPMPGNQKHSGPALGGSAQRPHTPNTPPVRQHRAARGPPASVAH